MARDSLGQANYFHSEQYTNIDRLEPMKAIRMSLSKDMIIFYTFSMYKWTPAKQHGK